MRIRDFRWQTDVLGPTSGILLMIWGILGDSGWIAVLGGYLIVVTTAYVLGRVQRIQADGSYKSLISEEWYKPTGARMIIVGMAAGALVLSVVLLLWGVPLYLAILTAVGIAIAWRLAWATLVRRRR